MTIKNIDYLNENHYGNFEQLHGKELEYYSKLLNKRDDEWYDPYAIRRETNDLVCIYDNAYKSSNKLFVNIKENKLYQR